MSTSKEIIGGDLVIGGRKLTLSKAVRAGDFVFLTGQVPMRDGQVMTDGSIEDQTRACLDEICTCFFSTRVCGRTAAAPPTLFSGTGGGQSRRHSTHARALARRATAGSSPDARALLCLTRV